MRLFEEGLIRVLSEISFTNFSLSNNAGKSDDVCCVLALFEGYHLSLSLMINDSRLAMFFPVQFIIIIFNYSSLQMPKFSLAMKVVIASSVSSVVSSGSPKMICELSSVSSTGSSRATSGFYLRSYQSLIPGKKAISKRMENAVIIMARVHPSQKCTLEL